MMNLRCPDPTCTDCAPAKPVRVVLCTTTDGCTCGAPASTPAGMHHCDCAVHPGWCGQPGCLPCEQREVTS